MFTNFKKKVQRIFFDPGTKPQAISEGNLDIVLSPRLYWVHKFSLPIDSLKEAKKLLPSLFEEFLPEGDYSYSGYFQEDGFIGFAYKQEEIIEALTQKGIDLSSIGSFRFAQSEIPADMTPCMIDEDSVLVFEEGILIVVPKSFVHSFRQLDLEKVQPSEYTVSIERNNTLIDKKTLYILTGFFIFFIFLNLLQYYKTATTVTELTQKRHEIYKKYALLPTSMQNKALLKKYEKINRHQKKLRKFMMLLQKVPLEKDAFLEGMQIEKNKAQVQFANIEDKTKILRFLKEFSPEHVVYKKKNLSFEVVL